MTKARDRARIVCDILTKAQTPTLRDNLRCGANLSFLSYKRHMEHLLKSALIEDVSEHYSCRNTGRGRGRTWYLTTKRGREWIVTYEKLIDIEKGGRSE